MIVFFGPHVRDPVQWQVFERLCAARGESGVAVGPVVDRVDEHRSVELVQEPPEGSPISRLIDLPEIGQLARARWIRARLSELEPSLVVLTVEPHDRVVLSALVALASVRRPRVVALAMENRVRLPGGWRGPAIRALWQRIDALGVAATATLDSFLAAGMPNSTPVALFPFAVQQPLDVPRAKLPVGGSLVVGYVGRLVEEKGVRVLLEAVERVPDVALVLAGPGPLMAEARAAASRHPRKIAALGPLARPEVWSLLRSIDCLALLSLSRPGWTEQFGYVLAEAMAVGTPVIGSDSGAIPEVIGNSGLVVPESDVGATVEELRRLAADRPLRQELGTRGLERYAAHFSIDACSVTLAGLAA